jgi:ATP phosphoribosyltransferase regulatory subunit
MTMTNNSHWMLPEGVEEVLPEQARRFEAMRRMILDLYASWGYELVMPPTVDFIESLLTGTGHDLDLQTFKFVDQLSGRTLGIRADMTPQVARIDAHHLKRDVPTRLCYIGTVLHARPEGIGDSRSPLQIGAELYGHAGVESEVEIIGLMLETFKTLHINDIYLDLGNVDIYRGLAKLAGLDNETESRLFDMLQRKAVTEIKALLDTLGVDDGIKAMIEGLTRLHGGWEVFEDARAILESAGAEVQQAIQYLEQTAALVKQRYGNIDMHFDLAELQGYHYKTGVVFAAFVPGTGQSIARGGRYDDIGKVFGQARAATGFSTDMKILDRLSSREFTVPGKIYAPASEDASLKQTIRALRSNGEIVVQQLTGQLADAQAMGCDRSLCLVDGEWVVQ